MNNTDTAAANVERMELLPCPFCGSDNLETHEGNVRNHAWVKCLDCCVCNCTKDWNTRAAIQPVPSQNNVAVHEAATELEVLTRGITAMLHMKSNDDDDWPEMESKTHISALHTISSLKELEAAAQKLRIALASEAQIEVAIHVEHGIATPPAAPDKLVEALIYARKRIEYLGDSHPNPRHAIDNEAYAFRRIDDALAAHRAGGA